ncbi:MAG: NAD(P)/FAD-dependent oxidoreductase [Myxococcales bacterium]|nr:NAD(P)/FAD-dependent oxidoreductase [Myxococcales bacterium]MCB9755198.1 NAD(P)/FAD-dependent oxidoreductase [Myxococcales bacterium]
MDGEPTHARYDFMILGGGIGGLVTGALLARAGARVLLVERHSALGGYAHSFRVDGYEFCYQVQYLMGCEPSGPMPRMLARLGLEREIGFNTLDPVGYDVVTCGDLEFRIPATSEAFCRALAARYPEHAEAIANYFARVEAVFAQADGYRRVVRPRDVLLAPWRHRALLRHMGTTVADVFDRLGLPEELRFILAGQAGNLASGPREASFLLHAGMQAAYGRSAAYPKRGLGHMVEAIARRIEEAPGCRVLRGVEVTAIHRAPRGRAIASVSTSAGRFSAGRYISNLDPRRTCALIGLPERAGPRYRYSDAVFTLYLGFEGVELADHGFGRRNFWIHSTRDIDREFDGLIREHRHDQPWIFLSTPSLLSDPGVLCAPDQASMVMLTFVSYARWQALAREPAALERAATQLEEVFLGALQRRFGLTTAHLRVRHRETPIDVVSRLAPPEGNVYGARLTPESYNLRRTTSRTRFANLDLVGATSAYPGVMPITVASMALVDRLLAARA